MFDRIIRDGHVHTPFCRHGSQDLLKNYVEEAIELGRNTMTFTEHFVLPQGIASQQFIEECSLLWEEVPVYLEAVEKVKLQYQDAIAILTGFEVDYIEGKEQQIREALDYFGPQIQDSILSVHFVLYKNQYYAIDCMDQFEQLLCQMGSLQAVYSLYYETLLKSIEADLGSYKPRRIGHPTLIRIFNQKYPFDYEDKGIFLRLIQALKLRGMEIDYNVAGLRKEYCNETYPSGKLLEMAKQEGIPLIPGSDSHQVSHLKVLEQLLF